MDRLIQNSSKNQYRKTKQTKQTKQIKQTKLKTVFILVNFVVVIITLLILNLYFLDNRLINIGISNSSRNSNSNNKIKIIDTPNRRTKDKNIKKSINTMLGLLKYPAKEENSDITNVKILSKNPNTTKQYQQDKPLPEGETQQFFNDVLDVFTNKIHLLDPDELGNYLSKLNEKDRMGVRSILNSLQKPSKNDLEAIQKLSMVDYLGYRAKWDDRVLNDIIEIVTTPVSSIKNIRYRATKIAEISELVVHLARIDLDIALDTLKDIREPVVKKYAANSLLDMLYDQGMDYQKNNRLIQSVLPDFSHLPVPTTNKL